MDFYSQLLQIWRMKPKTRNPRPAWENHQCLLSQRSFSFPTGESPQTILVPGAGLLTSGAKPNKNKRITPMMSHARPKEFMQAAEQKQLIK